MKYVVYQDGTREHMVLFPNSISHDMMAEALENLRFGGDNWHRNQGEIVSAGFVQGLECRGRSETLNKDSRKVDTDLYLRGLSREVSP